MKCPFCAEVIQDAAIKCKYCDSDIIKAPANTPIKPTYTTNWKRVGTVSFVGLVAIIILGINASKNMGVLNQDVQPVPAETPLVANQSDTATTTQTTAPSTQVTAPKTIQYEVVSQWNIPTGGKGEVVVIPVTYLNDADMTALGDKLKNDLINDRDAFVFVYTNKKAAALRDKVINDDPTPAELKLYDNNFVAVYTKNADTGFHKFQIMFGGVNGTNNKEITY